MDSPPRSNSPSGAPAVSPPSPPSPSSASQSSSHFGFSNAQFPLPPHVAHLAASGHYPPSVVPGPLVRSNSLSNMSAPTLVRSNSSQSLRGASMSPSQPAPSTPEWRACVSIEERTAVRNKIREAYEKNCLSYQQLLQTVIAIDEELLFGGSTSRMDYFKSAIDWDSRLQIKRKQLAGNLGVHGLSVYPNVIGGHHATMHGPAESRSRSNSPLSQHQNHDIGQGPSTSSHDLPMGVTLLLDQSPSSLKRYTANNSSPSASSNNNSHSSGSSEDEDATENNSKRSKTTHPKSSAVLSS
eukprot:TRINITY_DN13255_c0_g2_i7.p1 TRINITY_DN13255_c0_g2~~TRINITY_DN13255_c0_g2_i7.p1  ORF type:complete len:297 (+),score=42.14 TRINITY_DN13255_c0_g2_i7:84-974(+)